MQKLIQHRDRLLFVSLLVVYFLTRFYNLTIIPIFGDEAIYLNWSQTIAENVHQLFLPLSDGKQPLFMWFTALATFLIHHPLVATRTIAILAGCFSLVCVYFAVRALVSKKAAYIAMLFYIVTPIFFLYDRLGVPDGLLSAFGIWSFYFGIRLVKKPSVFNAILLGIMLGFGLLSKSPAIFFAILVPFILMIRSYKKTNWLQQIRTFSFYFVGSFVLSQVIYNAMRISPLFAVIGQRQQDFVFDPSHLLERPLDPFIPRISDVASWIYSYLTISIIGFAVVGLLLGIYKKQKAVFILLVWFFIPLLLEMALAKGFTPRYFLFTIPYIVLLASLGFYWLFSSIRRLQAYFPYVLPIFLLPAGVFCYQLLTNPQIAPIPEKERAGYLEDWTAGYGIAEVTTYIKSLPLDQKILVGTEGHFGTLPDGLIAYNRKSPNIHIEGMGQPADIHNIPKELFDWIASDKNHAAYLVVNKSRMHVDSKDMPHLKLLKEYPKAMGPSGQDFLLFYQVLP